MASFTQRHYNSYRLAGGDDDIEYGIVNGLKSEEVSQLRADFDTRHPEGVSDQKKQEFIAGMKEEVDKAQRRDILEWSTGMGRYGQ